MNDKPGLNIPVLVGMTLLGLLVFGAVIFAIFKPAPAPKSAKGDYLKETTITSPITKGTETFSVNLDSGEGNANASAVLQTFRIFGLESLKLPDITKSKLKELLPAALRQQFTPTDAVTFVHIDPATIKCDSNNNCTMSLYVDSPESYFDLSFAKVTGEGYVAKLTQQPWEGVMQ